MGAHCCEPEKEAAKGNRRLVLWVALVLNACMFGAEVVASFLADSIALRADAIDFLGDAANYGVSLFVLGMAIAVRARASLVKAACMGLFGVWVIATVVMSAIQGSAPVPEAMGALGFVALAVNLFVAYLLFSFRDGDSNMQSVWLCSRNDAIGNAAVMAAGGAVYFTRSAWPDLIVAVCMGLLSLQASYVIFRSARMELATGTVTTPPGHHH